MASTEEFSRKTAAESGYAGDARRPPPNSFAVDFSLRLLLFACSVTALVVLVTSKQSKDIPTSLPPPFPAFVSRDAKFQHSPAFIYELVALAVTVLYSIVAMIASLSAVSSPSPSAKLLFSLILFDVVMAGVMAAATGAAAAVAYIGLKGNTHVGWNKVCNLYGRFCWHIGSAAALSLAASILLVLLVLLSAYSLYRRSSSR